MIRLAASRLRHGAGRALVLLLGILVAATAFTVLTGTAETQRLRIVGTVDKNYRAQYDILVRPKGSATELERSSGLVRANYLSGIHGGITQAQYERIKKLDGIEVAAPIGMIGYMTGTGMVDVPVTDVLGEGERTLLRVDRTRVADRGLTRIPYAPHYAYITRRPLTSSMEGGAALRHTGEQVTRGKNVPIGTSLYWQRLTPRSGPFPFDGGSTTSAWSTANGDGDSFLTKVRRIRPGEATILLQQEFPLLLAAIDPQAEAALAGLDKAMVDGHYLGRPQDTPRGEIPLIAAGRPYADQQDELVISRLPARTAEKVVSGLPAKALRSEVTRQHGPIVKKVTVGTDRFFADMLHTWQHPVSDKSVEQYISMTRYWTAGPVEYGKGAGGRLKPVPVTNDPKVWQDPFLASIVPEIAGAGSAPIGSADAQFRRLDLNVMSGDVIRDDAMRVVGRFDPERLPGFSSLSSLPMETYNPPSVVPGDDRTSALLKGRGLLPSDNLAGYLQPPPLLLTDLASLRKIAGLTQGGRLAKAPLSVVRVRVAGVTGPDPVSRERISQVARDIVAATGLDVDITMGSSPAPVTVDLPAGSYGRPALTVKEGWVDKGVAYRILRESDRKSLALFVLILAVCGLFLVNASSAAVRTARTELGVLACLGWSRRKLFGGVLTETGCVGLLGGLLSAAVAVPVSSWFGLQVPAPRVLLTVPAALALALAAGLVPAWHASTVPPVEAVRPAARMSRRARSPRGVTGMALAGLTRVPGRTLLGGSTLLVCVFALTVLLGVTYGFRGRVVGSLLGDAIVLQARPADYAAIMVMFALGTLAVADVLYLGVRERDAELAALRATGWTGRSLARLVVSEGVLIGLAGGAAGAAAGLAATTALAGSLPWVVAAGGLGACVLAVLLAVLASALPAALVQRLPLAAILAQA
ncbi:FtsX-like permease family protein [Sphaerisporangium sp. NPDC004334]